MIIARRFVFLNQTTMLSEGDIIRNEVVFKHFGEYHPIISDPFSHTHYNNQIITETFIQESPIKIVTESIQSTHADWMVYTLFMLLFGISLVWYYFPERALSIFKIRDTKKDARSNYSTGNETPGIMILFFFILNYLLTISLFLYLSINELIQVSIQNAKGQYFLLIFTIGVTALYLFRIIVIFFSGFIFNTKEVAEKQLKMYINIDNIIGVSLIPILILVLFVQLKIVIYIGLAIILVLQIIKWFQTFLLGNSISGFSVLHLFMYLCTLELLPVVVLIKLFSYEFI